MYLIDLFRTKILTGRRLARLLADVARHGIQLSNVVAMNTNSNTVALRQGKTFLGYETLFGQVGSVSGFLFSRYRIRQGSHVLLILDNSVPSIILLLALSAIGCNIHLQGSIKDYDVFKRKVDPMRFDFLLASTSEKLEYYNEAGVQFVPSMWGEAITHNTYRPFVTVATTIGIFSSGTTGVPKASRRSNTLWQYLRAIADLVKTLELTRYSTVVLPVPLYHSYGLSALFLGLMLGKELVLINKFDAAEVAEAITESNAEVAILVPQMISRLTNYKVESLRCIVSCSDVLPASVLDNARSRFGDIIFNLYGTSETGLITIATPATLSANSHTIGRPIHGCRLKLIDNDGRFLLHVKSAFAIRSGYINTGDIVTRNEQNLYFYHGRADDMMVINGVNVYPATLIEMAHKHESVQHVTPRAYLNEEGFRRILLTLRVKEEHQLNEVQFKEWWLQTYGTQFLPSKIEIRTDDAHIKLMRN